MKRASALLVIAAVLGLAFAANTEARPKSVLGPGQVLAPGKMLAAKGGGPGRLVMKKNGQLVLQYHPIKSGAPSVRGKPVPPKKCKTRRCRFLRPRKVWAPKLRKRLPGAHLKLRRGGELVVAKSGMVLWSSKRSGVIGPRLVLRRRGELVVSETELYPSSRAGSAGVVWSSGSETPSYVGSTLPSGEALEPNQFIQDPKGLYQLEMRPGGRLVLWTLGAGPCPIWMAPESYSDDSAPVSGSKLQMMSSGTLALFAPDGQAVWQWADYQHAQETPTPVPGSYLSLLSSGDLQVIGPTGSLIWNTNSDYARGRVLCPGEKLWYGQVLASPIQGPGSQYAAGSWLEISTYGAEGKGYEIDVVSGGDPHLGTSTVFHDKGGPNAAGMYLELMQSGDLQAIVASTGLAQWDSGTDGFENVFATTDSLSNNLVLVQMSKIEVGGESKTGFKAIYAEPNAPFNIGKAIGQAEKISMGMAPMG